MYTLKVKAICPDMKVRTIYFGSQTDLFSNQAWTRIKGKYVAGFIDVILKADLPPSMMPSSSLEFVAYKRYGIPNYIRTVKALWQRKQGAIAWTKESLWIW